MFTGIVEAIGQVVAVERAPDGRRLRIEAPFADSLTPGTSVCVAGACLTVEAKTADWFEVFLATETVERTTLGSLGSGDGVNLERALAATGRFDGHIVQGHVDGTADVITIEPVGEDWTYVFSLPADLERYVVEKGSIAVDGISLTVADRESDRVTVAIIPTTYAETTLSDLAPGETVNVEVDVIAKYVEGLVEPYARPD